MSRPFAIVLVGCAIFVYALSRRPAAEPPVVFEEVLTPPTDVDRTPRINERWRSEVLRTIGDSYTYLPQMLLDSDSLIRRWENRLNRPIVVFLEPTELASVTSRVQHRVRDGFDRWLTVPEIPIDFVFGRQAEQADVVVRWIHSFPSNRAGQAEIEYDGGGWIRKGVLTLATHAPSGAPYTEDAMFTVTLHEVGHLLGLGHSDQPADVMFPTTSVHDLTIRDRQTALFMYQLPAGSLKAPR